MTRAARRIGVFPGQFDPITNGHLDVIRRGKVLFDELIVAVGVNPDKRELFSLDERVGLIRGLIRELSGVHVERYGGLTVDFVRSVKATAILRGILDVSDFGYEFQLALAKRAVGAAARRAGCVCFYYPPPGAPPPPPPPPFFFPQTPPPWGVTWDNWRGS